MNDITARDALEYATRDELLKLYGVIVSAWGLLFVGSFALGLFGPLASVVGLLFVVAGVGTFLSGVVAIAYKVLAEGRSP